MITEVPGVRVGHWTHATAPTGCTVVLLPASTVASGEVRGGAPGTREWALLAPERMMPRVDAVVLTGGSAFGLAACDGVMRWCEERGVGFPTPAGPVPIVVGMVLFDLLVGAEDGGSVRPGPDSGYAACEAATAGPVATGAVGAGAGATVGTWRGFQHARPGGIGTASARHGELVVASLMAVNAFGDVLGARSPGVPARSDSKVGTVGTGTGITDTTIGVVATNASLHKVECLLVAQAGQDGLARATEPAHALEDGDAIVAASVGGVTAPVNLVRALAMQVVEDAVSSAVPS